MQRSEIILTQAINARAYAVMAVGRVSPLRAGLWRAAARRGLTRPTMTEALLRTEDKCCRSMLSNFRLAVRDRASRTLVTWISWLESGRESLKKFFLLANKARV